ncbi:MAG: divergent polysaccharide deacetylase family protein [Roseobacter sp.]
MNGWTGYLNAWFGRTVKEDEQNLAKSFIKGAFWGAGVGVGAVAFASVMDSRSSEQSVMERIAPVAVTVIDEAPTEPVRVLRDGPSGVGLTAQEMPSPEPDTLAGLLSDTLNSAAVPQTGGISDLPATSLTLSDGKSDVSGQDSSLNEPILSDDVIVVHSISETPPIGVSSFAQIAQTDVVPDVTFKVAAEPSDKPKEAVSASAPSNQAQPQPDVTTDVGILAAPDVGVEISDVSVFATQPATPRVSDAAKTTGISESLAKSSESAVEGVGLPQVLDTDGDEKKTGVSDQDKKQAAEAVLFSPAIIEVVQQPSLLTIPAINPSSVAPESVRPKTPKVAALPATLPTVQQTGQGESVSAKVVALLAIEPPTIQISSGTGTSVGKKIAPGPDQVTASLLADVSPHDKGVATGVTKTAKTLREGRAVLNENTATGLTSADSSTVRINRLPSLSDAPSPTTEESVAPIVDKSKPIDLFASAFDAEQGKPLMAIVLVDEGVDLSATTIGISALKNLPYPVSFAVDALLPDAAERMAQYRAAGFEVLASVDLPSGATAVDAEINLSVALEDMPEVVGVLDGVGTGIQTTPDAGRQVAQILAQTGHGFVTQNRGLNTVQKLAARNGVPSGVVFRDFDSKGQTTTVIRRFLDQAAFRAGQEGAVIMLGRVREETVSALVLWTLQDRAATVEMSPISAVLSSIDTN